MKKSIWFFAHVLLIIYLWSDAVYAICPLCTIAVSAGIGCAQCLGVDDTITGIWIGGLTVSMIFWTLTWLQKRVIHFWGRNLIVVLGYYSIVIFSLYLKQIIGKPLNMLFGVDKLLLGIILGSIFFTIGVMTHFYCKKRNNNRVYIPFQKVLFPIANLVILSSIFYFITK